MHEDFVYVYAETLNSIWFGEESWRRCDGDAVCQRRLLQQGSLWDMVHKYTLGTPRYFRFTSTLIYPSILLDTVGLLQPLYTLGTPRYCRFTSTLIYPSILLDTVGLLQP